MQHLSFPSNSSSVGYNPQGNYISPQPSRDSHPQQLPPAISNWSVTSQESQFSRSQSYAPDASNTYYPPASYYPPAPHYSHDHVEYPVQHPDTGYSDPRYNYQYGPSHSFNAPASDYSSYPYSTPPPAYSHPSFGYPNPYYPPAYGYPYSPQHYPNYESGAYSPVTASPANKISTSFNRSSEFDYDKLISHRDAVTDQPPEQARIAKILLKAKKAESNLSSLINKNTGEKIKKDTLSSLYNQKTTDEQDFAEQFRKLKREINGGKITKEHSRREIVRLLKNEIANAVPEEKTSSDNEETVDENPNGQNGTHHILPNIRAEIASLSINASGENSNTSHVNPSAIPIPTAAAIAAHSTTTTAASTPIALPAAAAFTNLNPQGDDAIVSTHSNAADD